MRSRFCEECGEWHPLDAWPEKCMKFEEDKSADFIQAPMLVRDEMDKPMQSMADGKYYTSKRAMRHSYVDNRQGKRFVEVGDDSSITNPKPRKPVRDGKDKIMKSVQKGMQQAGFGA